VWAGVVGALSQTANGPSMTVRTLGLCDYSAIFNQMQQFSAQRDINTRDEIWLLQHPPVYTLGRNGKREHILNPHGIPVLQVDRGGQVTYHGPGQWVAYVLFDVRRAGWGVRQLVSAMEHAVIALLAELAIEGHARPDAPGVYVNGDKIASLGLRVKNGKSYHGLSLNVDMDLTPFDGINPCGMAGLGVTQIVQFSPSVNMDEVGQQIIKQLRRHLVFGEGVGDIDFPKQSLNSRWIP